MLFRQAGIFHTDYASDRALFPIAADRYMIGILLLLGLAAPLYLNSLYLSSYLLPWLVWTAGALGLNLILGWAGQFHLGYAAVMGIGAYAAVHATKFGIPWEIAIILAGSTAAIIGIGFAFAALRVKGLYLALSTLALQFVMDWTISHVPAISGGTQATSAGAGYPIAGLAHNLGCRTILHRTGLVHHGDILHAQSATNGTRPCPHRGSGKGLCRRRHRREQLLLQASGLRRHPPLLAA